MGLFTSYCKECNNKIEWFVGLKYGFIICKKCDYINTQPELLESMNDEKHWKHLFRNKKIKKILDENSTNN